MGTNMLFNSKMTKNKQPILEETVCIAFFCVFVERLARATMSQVLGNADFQFGRVKYSMAVPEVPATKL